MSDLPKLGLAPPKKSITTEKKNLRAEIEALTIQYLKKNIVHECERGESGKLESGYTTKKQRIKDAKKKETTKEAQFAKAS